MEEKKQVGGNRENAGRKPINEELKKVPITVYVTKKYREEIKEAVLGFIESYKPTGRKVKETPKNSQKNESDKVLADDVVKKIEELQKLANSCQDTRLGKMAKAGYLNQIEQLKNQNK